MELPLPKIISVPELTVAKSPTETVSKKLSLVVKPSDPILAGLPKLETMSESVRALITTSNNDSEDGPALKTWAATGEANRVNPSKQSGDHLIICRIFIELIVANQTDRVRA